MSARRALLPFVLKMSMVSKLYGLEMFAAATLFHVITSGGLGLGEMLSLCLRYVAHGCQVLCEMSLGCQIPCMSWLGRK